MTCCPRAPLEPTAPAPTTAHTCPHGGGAAHVPVRRLLPWDTCSAPAGLLRAARRETVPLQLCPCPSCLCALGTLGRAQSGIGRGHDGVGISHGCSCSRAGQEAAEGGHHLCALGRSRAGWGLPRQSRAELLGCPSSGRVCPVPARWALDQLMGRHCWSPGAQYWAASVVLGSGELGRAKVLRG